MCRSGTPPQVNCQPSIRAWAARFIWSWRLIRPLGYGSQAAAGPATRGLNAGLRRDAGSYRLAPRAWHTRSHSRHRFVTDDRRFLKLTRSFSDRGPCGPRFRGLARRLYYHEIVLFDYFLPRVLRAGTNPCPVRGPSVHETGGWFKPGPSSRRRFQDALTQSATGIKRDSPWICIWTRPEWDGSAHVRRRRLPISCGFTRRKGHPSCSMISCDWVSMVLMVVCATDTPVCETGAESIRSRLRCSKSPA